MKLIRFKDLDRYYDRVKEHLLDCEAANCLLLAHALASCRHDELYAVAVEDRDRIIATAIHVPPRKLLISRSSNLLAVEAIARDFVAGGRSVVGMTSSQAEAEAFVAVWQDLTNNPVELEVSMQVHQLKTGTAGEIDPAVGELRLATEAETELLTQWVRQFAKEALGVDESIAESRGWVTRNIEQNSLYVWQYGDSMVSMTACGGKTPNGIRIKSVYTPPQDRGKGFATSLVTAISQHLLKQNKYCFLFTDTANPISNRIYRKIGYVPMADISDYNFYFC